MGSRKPEDRGFRKIVPLARVQLLTDALFALSMMVILLAFGIQRWHRKRQAHGTLKQ